MKHSKIDRFTPASARVLVAMVHYEQDGVLPPDRVIAESLRLGRTTVNGWKLRLAATGYVSYPEGRSEPCRLQEDFITRSDLAAIAAFIWKAWIEHFRETYQGIPIHRLRRKLWKEFPRYTRNWCKVINELVNLGYLRRGASDRLHPDERIRREVEYLRLLGQAYLSATRS